jgi:hypothetical protein
MDQLEIGKLDDRQLVQATFDEYYGPYSHEDHGDRLLNAQYKALRDASEILDWNWFKKRRRSSQVAEARARLRGWLNERLYR